MIRYTSNMLMCLTVVMCCLFFSHAASASENNEADRKGDMIRKIVIEAADNVSWDPEEQRDYLEIIEPVLQMGERALPVLNKLGKNSGLTAFQRRIAQLIGHRIENPRAFSHMEEFLKTYVLYWPGRRDMRYASIGSGKLKMEMLKLDLKKFVEEHKEVIANFQLYPEPRTVLCGEKTEEFYNKFKELGVSEEESELLTLIIRRPVRFMSSGYLLPFEEAVVRILPPFEGTHIKRIQMQQRLAIMRDLMQFDEPHSATVLAELGRRLSVTEKETKRRYFISFKGTLESMFENWPEEVVLREIVRTVEFEREHPEARNHSRSILNRISRSEEWHTFLEQSVQSDDPQVVEDAETVKELIQDMN